MVPIEGTGEWEKRIACRRVASISYQGIDPGFVRTCAEPAGVEIGYNRCSVDEIA